LSQSRHLTAVTIRGVAAQTGGTLLLNALALCRGIILRRFYLPAELGQLETALLPLSFTMRLSQLGTRQALMRVRERFDEVAGTALTFDFLISSAAYLLLLLAAPWVARWFDSPELTVWIRALAITVYSTTLALPAAAWDRAMRFGISKVPRAAGTVATVVLAVWAALSTTWGASGLLVAALVGFATEHALIWVLAPSRPRPRWNGADARGLAKFSMPLLAGALAGYVVFEGDDIMVRTFGTDRDLALYTAAFEWPFYLTTLVAMTSAVLYPALLEAGEPVRRGRAFLRANRLIAAATVPVGVALVVFAPALVATLYGADWAPAVPMLQIFALAFTLRVATGYNWHLLPMSRGDNRQLLLITAVSAVLTLALGIPLIARWGGLGGAVTNAVVALAWAIPARAVLIRREIGTLSFLGDLTRPLLASIAAAGVGLVASRALGAFGASGELAGGLLPLTVTIVAFGVAYAVALGLLDRPLVIESRALALLAVRRGGPSETVDPNDAADPSDPADLPP
jgi:PST family polysaccharide transporter